MAYKEDFDERAATWDDDPVKHERARTVASAIRERVPLSSGMRALEYGCGTGLLSFELRASVGHFTLADRSDGMLEVLRKKLQAANATNMVPVSLDLIEDPLPDERYDFICTMMTFHHIEDTDAILRAMSSLLESPGYLCVADLDSEDGSFHGEGFHGHNGFDRDELARKANKAGFHKVGFSTVFRTKGGEEQEREYPMFLMVAEK